MIYKNTSLLFALVLSLTACSSIPQFGETSRPQPSVIEEQINTEEQTSTEEQASAEEVHVDNSQVDALDAPKTVEPITSQLNTNSVAYGLISQSDLYFQSKRSLAPDVKAQVVLALELYNKGDFIASKKAINKVILNALNLSSSVYVLAGDIALANTEQTQAETYYKQALDKNEYNAKAANRLGKLMREKGEFSSSERLYTQAINAQPAHVQSYRNRAVLYDLYLHEKSKALADYETYAALLDYALQEHELTSEPRDSASIDTSIAASRAKRLNSKLDETELKALKQDMELVKRWIIDVGRQASVQANLASDN